MKIIHQWNRKIKSASGNVPIITQEPA